MSLPNARYSHLGNSGITPKTLPEEDSREGRERGGGGNSGPLHQHLHNLHCLPSIRSPHSQSTQAPGIRGSALGPVVPVSVYCDWVR